MRSISGDVYKCGKSIHACTFNLYRYRKTLIQSLHLKEWLLTILQHTSQQVQILIVQLHADRHPPFFPNQGKGTIVTAYQYKNYKMLTRGWRSCPLPIQNIVTGREG